MKFGTIIFFKNFDAPHIKKNSSGDGKNKREYIIKTQIYVNVEVEIYIQYFALKVCIASNILGRVYHFKIYYLENIFLELKFWKKNSNFAHNFYLFY